MRKYRLIALVCALAVTAWPLGKKKNKEEETQTLQLPKDPPSAVVAETRRLVFSVSPLSAKGLLSQQARDALKAVTRVHGGAQIVKIRAFVAGRGDLRRVRDIVSEAFTERRQPLPAVSVVQVGALPLEAAQVVMETTAVAKKDTGQYGLVFLSGQGESSAGPLDPIAPLAEKAIPKLAAAAKAAGSEPADVTRVTCFVSSLDGVQQVRLSAQTVFPEAALDIVQAQRAPARARVECEAVARLRRAAQPLEFTPDAALVGANRVVISGTQSSFGYQDTDARLAFERLGKAIEPLGVTWRDVAFAGIYPLSESIAEQVRKLRFQFFESTHPPATTLIPFEGLPSMDAGFAVEVVAAKKD